MDSKRSTEYLKNANKKAPNDADATEPEPDGESSQDEPQGQINPRIEEIQRDAGVELFDQDEEISMLDRTNGQDAFYKSIEAACEAKKATMDGTQGWEYLQNANPRAIVSVDPNPPPPETGMDYLTLASKESAEAYAKPSQAEINQQYLRYWRGQGPKPAAGTMYKEYADDQPEE